MPRNDRDEFLSVFFGRVVAREVLRSEEPRKESAAAPEASRESSLPIHAIRSISPHVVDLKPARPKVVRGVLDFEQKLAVWAHAVRVAVAPNSTEEHRRLVPKRDDRRMPSVAAGFLKLPWALLTLPLRRREAALKSAPRAARPVVMRPLMQTAPAPKPVGMTAPVQTPASNSCDRKETTRPLAATSREPRIHVPAAPLIFHTHPNWGRRIAAFAVLALVVSLPIHALLSYAGLTSDAKALTSTAGAALADLRAAGDGTLRLDPEAGAAFSRAADGFAESRKRVQGLTVRLAAFVAGEGEKLAGGTRLLGAAEAISRAGAELSSAFDGLEASDATLTARLGGVLTATAAALPQLDAASAELDAIPLRSVPARYRDAFGAVRDDLHFIREDLAKLTASSDVILRILGDGGKRRYLVLFQNSRELRPTGGFIGSFALMDVKDGSITNIEVPAGGPYDLRAGLMQRVAAPEQLRLVNPRWEFQDANWFADFPASADALMWFYEKSGGPTVDGTVAITSDLMVELLKALGPVELPEHGRTVTAENFYDVTQRAVELEYDRELNRPKQFISDLAPKLLKRLVDGGASQALALSGAVTRALSSKDIQVRFRDEAEQATAASFGWTGELAPLPGADFLAVVHANIAGGKTDGAIAEHVAHESVVQEDGSIVDTVTIRRTHGGAKGDLFSGVKNIDYVRVFVPRGSELVSAEGFEKPGEGYFLQADETLKPSTLLAAVEGDVRVDEASGTRVSEESGLTAFGNWIQLEPGETRSVRLSYRLPFTLGSYVRTPDTAFERAADLVGAFERSAGLKLVVRKQPGASNRTFSTLIRPPEGWEVKSVVPAGAEVAGDALKLETPLEHDLYVGMIVAPRR